MGTGESESRQRTADAERLQEMLDRLDGAPASERKHPRRSERRPFRTNGVQVQVIDGHGSPVSRPFKVVTRNLCAHGLAFLHRSMLATNQRLRIHIPVQDGRPIELLARVARCRYVSDMVHEIGVEFIASRPAGAAPTPPAPPAAQPHPTS